MERKDAHREDHATQVRTIYLRSRISRMIASDDNRRRATRSALLPEAGMRLARNEIGPEDFLRTKCLLSMKGSVPWWEARKERAGPEEGH